MTTSETLTLKSFLENRVRTIRRSNPHAALFAEVMSKRIKCDIYSPLAFWNICHDVFGENEIAAKLCYEAWTAFDFKRSLVVAGIEADRA